MAQQTDSGFRRQFLKQACVLALGLGCPVLKAAQTDEAESPPLITLLRHPLLLQSLYRLPVSNAYAPEGAAGTNQSGYRWIEEQRQGAEWIVRGLAQERRDWLDLGWKQLDWGLAQQLPDGSFGSQDPFHSTSFFVEALARSCLLDPAQASAARRDKLARAARWLISESAEAKGIANNRPYTHRRYILAAGIGQAGSVTGERTLRERAAEWAWDGVQLQRADGTNPEKGGFDAGYQMVGILMALRYLPVCHDRGLRAQLRQMIRKGVALELGRLQPDGSIDAAGSTRIELEKSRSGKIKSIPYGEIMQALVYGAQAVPEPLWLEPAREVAKKQKWLRG